MLQVKSHKVTSSYNGQSGKCCCGCAGKHRYPSSQAQNGKKLRGYEIDADEVSDRAVNMAIKKIEKMSALEPENMSSGDNYIAYDDGGRLTIVYFN